MFAFIIAAAMIVSYVSGQGQPESTPKTISLNKGINPERGGCRYWCRTHDGRIYCCQAVNQGQSKFDAKPGQCPIVRATCDMPVIDSPENLKRLPLPRTCAHDGACPGVDRCCYDKCLQSNVCKTPLYNTGQIGVSLGSKTESLAGKGNWTLS